MVTLRIAGVEIQLDGHTAPLAERLAALAPFTRPASCTHRVRIDLLDETGRPDVGSHDFSYARVDLELALDTRAGAGEARIDESRGAFEALLELTLQATLLRADGLLVHASAAVLDGHAWLMPGPSGAGKSTAARAGGFERVLSDEMVVLRGGPGGFVAWGTPFWSEGRARPYDVGSAPLAVLARLHKAAAPAATPLPDDEAVAHLLRCVALYEHGSEARQRAFERACEVVETTRCLKLSFPKKGPWASKVGIRT